MKYKYSRKQLATKLNSIASELDSLEGNLANLTHSEVKDILISLINDSSELVDDLLEQSTDDV